MNIVRIKFDPFQDKCTISLNGETLPEQNTLNRYINRSLLANGDTLLKDIGDFVNDEYALSVIGTDFEKFFMGDLQQKYADCVKYSVEAYDTKVDLGQRFLRASDVISKGTDEYKEIVYSEIDTELDERLAKRTDNAKDATLCIAADMRSAEALAEISGAQLIIYPSDSASIRYTGTKKCLWGVKNLLLEKRIKATVERFAIPRCIRLAEKVDRSAETLKSISTAVHVQVPETMVAGDIVSPEFTAERNDVGLPDIRIESSNRLAVVVENGMLVAVGEGSSTLSFYRDYEVDPFSTAVVNVKADHYIHSIHLSAPKGMVTGRDYSITAQCEPNDSPEINKLSWKVGDPDILRVDSSGKIHALKAGKTRITVTAERVSQSIDVEVFEGLGGIVLSEDRINIYIGEKREISFDLQPDTYSKDKIVCKSTKENVAVVSKNEKGKWIVKGKGIEAGGNREGHCQLIFSEEDGDCTATCEVTVMSTIKNNERKEKFLAGTAAAVLLAFILQFFSLPVGYAAIGVAVVAAALGVIGIIKNKSDLIWQIIFIVISLLIIAAKIIPLFTA